MTQIEQIKAEIERRMKINQWDDSEGSDVAFSEDKRLLSFIESLEQEQSPKIKGWVARDSIEDGFWGMGLCMHKEKPIRTGGEWSTKTLMCHLPYEMFPDLKWEDEPIEVELTIDRV